MCITNEMKNLSIFDLFDEIGYGNKWKWFVNRKG